MLDLYIFFVSANNVEDAIPSNATWIYIEKDLDKGFDYRKIIVERQETL